MLSHDGLLYTLCVPLFWLAATILVALSALGGVAVLCLLLKISQLEDFGPDSSESDTAMLSKGGSQPAPLSAVGEQKLDGLLAGDAKALPPHGHNRLVSGSTGDHQVPISLSPHRREKRALFQAGGVGFTPRPAQNKTQNPEKSQNTKTQKEFVLVSESPRNAVVPKTVVPMKTENPEKSQNTKTQKDEFLLEPSFARSFIQPRIGLTPGQHGVPKLTLHAKNVRTLRLSHATPLSDSGSIERLKARGSKPRPKYDPVRQAEIQTVFQSGGGLPSFAAPTQFIIPAGFTGLDENHPGTMLAIAVATLGVSPLPPPCYQVTWTNSQWCVQEYIEGMEGLFTSCSAGPGNIRAPRRVYHVPFLPPHFLYMAPLQFEAVYSGSSARPRFTVLWDALPEAQPYTPKVRGSYLGCDPNFPNESVAVALMNTAELQSGLKTRRREFSKKVSYYVLLAYLLGLWQLLMGFFSWLWGLPGRLLNFFHKLEAFVGRLNRVLEITDGTQKPSTSSERLLKATVSSLETAAALATKSATAASSVLTAVQEGLFGVKELLVQFGFPVVETPEFPLIAAIGIIAVTLMAPRSQAVRVFVVGLLAALTSKAWLPTAWIRKVALQSEPLTEMDEIELQSAEDWAPAASFLMAAAGVSYASRSSIEALAKIGSAHRTISGITSALLKWYADHVESCENGDPKFKEIQELRAQMIAKAVKPDCYHEVRGLAQMVTEKCLDLMRNKHNKVPVLREMWSEANGIIKSSTLADPTTRPEPVFIVLHGDAGTGKSTLADEMIKRYVTNTFDTLEEYQHYTSEPGKYEFRRVLSSPYWEGVTPMTRAVFMDDLFQRRESATSDPAFGPEIISLVNGAAFIPNMAFESKGKLVIAPRIVIATTNLTRLHSEAIVSNTALQRRVAVDLTVRTEEGKPAIYIKFPDVAEQRITVDLALWFIEEMVRVRKLMFTSNALHQVYPGIAAREFPTPYQVFVAVSELCEGKHYAPKWTSPIKFTPYDGLLYSDLLVAQEAEIARAIAQDKLATPAPSEEALFLADLERLAPKVDWRAHFNPPWRKVAQIGAVTAAVALAGYALSYLLTPSVVPQSNVHLVARKSNRVVNKPARVVKQAVELQALPLDAAVYDQQRKRILRVEVHYSDSKSVLTTELGYAYALTDKLIVMPTHFVHEAISLIEGFPAEADVLRFYSGSTAVAEIGVSDDRFTGLTPEGLVQIEVPCGIPGVKTLTLTPPSIRTSLKAGAVAVRLTPTGIVCGPVRIADSVHIQAGFAEPFDIGPVWKVSAPNQKGDCGLPYFVEYGGRPCFVGLHLAGNGRDSYASIHLGEQPVGDRPEVPELIFLRETLPTLQVRHVEEKVWISTKPDAVPVSGSEGKRTTHFIPYKPENMASSLTHFLNPPPILSEQELTDLSRCAVATAKFLRKNLDVSRDPVSLQEAVFGGTRLKPLNPSSSPGIPYVLDGRRKNEYITCGLPGPRFPELYAKLQEFNQDIHNGRTPEVVFNCFPKIERYALEKTDKVRPIFGSPLDYAIMVRLHYGAFIAAVTANPISSGTAVGLNPYSSWHLLANHLFEVGGPGARYGAGDYSKFDSSQSPELLRAVASVIEMWYGSEGDSAVRRRLFEAAVNAQFVHRDFVLQMEKGLPSGHPLTTIINCVLNHILFRLAWLRSGHDLSDFESKVRLVVLGDDNVFAVHSTITDFTEATLSEHLAPFGLKYTSDSKSLARAGLSPLTEVTFLKRGFRKEGKLWVGPLAKPTIEEMVRWTVHKDGSPNSSCVRQACMEASLHGRAYYDSYLNWNKNLFGPEGAMLVGYEDQRRLLAATDLVFA
jgi:hypothetical protein